MLNTLAKGDASQLPGSWTVESTPFPALAWSRCRTIPANDTATTEIYTLSLRSSDLGGRRIIRSESTRLNSSHTLISYAVFCLKKKTHNNHQPHRQSHIHHIHHP